LSQRDLDAEDCFAELVASCAPSRAAGTALDGALSALETEMRALDFEAARACLGALKPLAEPVPALGAR